MVSYRSIALAVAATFAAVAQADYYIDPNSVDLGLREYWCDNEKSTCPIICQQVKPGTTLVNTCDPEALTYGCLCGDNKQPNVSEYSLTLPYYVCQEWGVQCVANCNADTACESACTQDHPCGAQNPGKAKNASETSGTASAAAPSKTSDTTIFGAPSSSGSPDTDKTGAGAALHIGQGYGLAIVVGGLFAGFALL